MTFVDTLEVTFCGHYTALVYVTITSVEFYLFMPGLETITSLLRTQGHHEELEVPWDYFSLLALCIWITFIDHSSSTFILISVTLITFEGITGRKMKLNVNLLCLLDKVFELCMIVTHVDIIMNIMLQTVFVFFSKIHELTDIFSASAYFINCACFEFGLCFRLGLR